MFRINDFSNDTLVWTVRAIGPNGVVTELQTTIPHELRFKLPQTYFHQVVCKQLNIPMEAIVASPYNITTCAVNYPANMRTTTVVYR
jgi:hypothetical protein